MRGQTPVWPWNKPKNKIHISAYTQPTHLIFGTVIDIVSIFYHTKNQVGGLCVGGVSNETRRTSHSPWEVRRVRPGEDYREQSSKSQLIFDKVVSASCATFFEKLCTTVVQKLCTFLKSCDSCAAKLTFIKKFEKVLRNLKFL